MWGTHIRADGKKVQVPRRCPRIDLSHSSDKLRASTCRKRRVKDGDPNRAEQKEALGSNPGLLWLRILAIVSFL
jgi:hypothetical protein